MYNRLRQLDKENMVACIYFANKAKKMKTTLIYISVERHGSLVPNLIEALYLRHYLFDYKDKNKK